MSLQILRSLTDGLLNAFLLFDRGEDGNMPPSLFDMLPDVPFDRTECLTVYAAGMELLECLASFAPPDWLAYTAEHACVDELSADPAQQGVSLMVLARLCMTAPLVGHDGGVLNRVWNGSLRVFRDGVAKNPGLVGTAAWSLGMIDVPCRWRESVWWWWWW